MNDLIVLCKWDDDILFGLKNTDVILIYDDYDRLNHSISYEMFKDTFLITSFDSLEEVDAVSTIIKNHYSNVSKVISFCEYSQYGAGYIARELGCNMMSFSDIQISRNKYKMKRFASDRNIKTTNFEEINDIYNKKALLKKLSRLNFPVVIKPINGMGADHTKVCNSEKEVWQYRESILNTNCSKQLIAEEFIEGEEFHADAIIHENTLKLLSISKYINPPLGWENRTIDSGYCLTYQKNIELYDLIRRQVLEIYKNLHMNPCVIHYEFFITPSGEIVFSEFATRIGGGPINMLVKHATNGKGLKANFLYELNSTNNNDNTTILPIDDKYYAYLNVRPIANGKVTQLPSSKLLSEFSCVLDYEYICQLDQPIDRWGILICFFSKNIAEIENLATKISKRLLPAFKFSRDSYDT